MQVQTRTLTEKGPYLPRYPPEYQPGKRRPEALTNASIDQGASQKAGRGFAGAIARILTIGRKEVSYIRNKDVVPDIFRNRSAELVQNNLEGLRQLRRRWRRRRREGDSHLSAHRPWWMCPEQRAGPTKCEHRPTEQKRLEHIQYPLTTAIRQFRGLQAPIDVVGQSLCNRVSNGRVVACVRVGRI